MTAIALYVQQGDSQYRKYFEENLIELHRGFKKQNMDLVFLSALGLEGLPKSKSAHFTEGLRKYLDVYYPSFKQLSQKQQQQVLFILAKSFGEFEIYEELKQLFGLKLTDGAYLFYIKPGQFEYEKLDEDANPGDFLKDFTSNLDKAKARTYQLDPYYLEEFHSQSQNWNPSEVMVLPDAKIGKTVQEFIPEFQGEKSSSLPQQRDNWEETISLSPELIRLLDTVQALDLQQGITDMLDAILHIVPQLGDVQLVQNPPSISIQGVTTHSVLLSLSQILQNQEGRALPPSFIPSPTAIPEEGGEVDEITLSVEQQSLALPYLKRLSKLIVTHDFRILMMDMDTPLSLDPLHRAVYLLFLNHPEGIELQCMRDHYEELFTWYNKTATHESLEMLKSRVSALCNPLENSIYEKISRINKVIKRVAGEENANSYIITGERYQPKKVHLREEMIVWLNRQHLA